MEFKDRMVQYPEHRKLKKIDPVTHQETNEDPIYVSIERYEGQLTETGTPINAHNLNAIGKAGIPVTSTPSQMPGAGNGTNGDRTGWRTVVGTANSHCYIDYVDFGNGLRLVYGYFGSPNNNSPVQINFGFSFSEIYHAETSNQNFEDGNAARYAITDLTKNMIQVRAGARNIFRWSVLGKM